MSEVAEGSRRVNLGYLGGRSPRLLLALLAIGTAMLFLGSRAEAAIYWTNGSEGTIGRAESDGTLAEQDFITGLETPRAVAIDGEHIYWTDLGTESIGRADLDGTDVEPEFVPNVGVAFGLAVYGGHIYWTSRSTESIGRADLDGSNVADEFIGPRLTPTALTVDAEGIFWTEAVEIEEEEFEYRIVKASLAGTGIGSLTPPITSLPYGLAHDPDGFFWSISADQSIASSNPEATSWSDLYIEEVSGPEGLALDPDYLYWAAAGSNSIGRENLTTETVEHELHPDRRTTAGCGRHHRTDRGGDPDDLRLGLRDRRPWGQGQRHRLPRRGQVTGGDDRIRALRSRRRSLCGCAGGDLGGDDRGARRILLDGHHADRRGHLHLGRALFGR